jgi:hypothetical protein
MGEMPSSTASDGRRHRGHAVPLSGAWYQRGISVVALAGTRSMGPRRGACRDDAERSTACLRSRGDSPVSPTTLAIVVEDPAIRRLLELVSQGEGDRAVVWYVGEALVAGVRRAQLVLAVVDCQGGSTCGDAAIEALHDPLRPAAFRSSRPRPTRRWCARLRRAEERSASRSPSASRLGTFRGSSKAHWLADSLVADDRAVLHSDHPADRPALEGPMADEDERPTTDPARCRLAERCFAFAV